MSCDVSGYVIMTDETEKWSPKEAWRRFRLEAEAAKNYPLSYAMYIGQTHRDVFLEQVLPTLLYVKAVAILDDALALWLADNGHRLAKPYRDDLNGRLQYLADKALLDGVDRMQDIRRKRNEFAHEPGASCVWSDLERDVALIETCLVSLGLTRDTPKLEYFSERSAMEGSTEPGIKFSRRFSYGVKENGKIALEVTWVQKFHED